ncbi:hypothetical protein FA95DRAFT_1555703 [Auriscalpium vulgare]|uniref:Uncharacterized protein n=1 Tax=Auriscalpium vulgare TaxID=40419 RepID=A0ACB8S270_9AGAM|nr:hypothetical protein FA95DRAFT_1555703 [Auriscalpium vulgare]
MLPCLWISLTALASVRHLIRIGLHSRTQLLFVAVSPCRYGRSRTGLSSLTRSMYVVISSSFVPPIDALHTLLAHAGPSHTPQPPQTVASTSFSAMCSLPFVFENTTDVLSLSTCLRCAAT